MTKRTGILIAVIAALVAGGLAIGLGLMSNSHATEPTTAAHTAATTTTTTTRRRQRSHRRLPSRRLPCRPHRPHRPHRPRHHRRRQRPPQRRHRRQLSTVLLRTMAAIMTPTTTEGRAMATETSDQVGSFRRTGRVPARARVPRLISSHAPRGVRRPARSGGSPPVFTCGRRDTPTSRPSPSPWKLRRWLRVGGSPAGVPAARPLDSCGAVSLTTQGGPKYQRQLRLFGFGSQGLRLWPKGWTWSPSAADVEG